MKIKIPVLLVLLMVAFADSPTGPAYYAYLRGTLTDDLVELQDFEVILCRSDFSDVEAEEITESVPEGSFWNNQVKTSTDSDGQFILSLFKFRAGPFFPSVCVQDADTLIKIYETGDTTVVMSDTVVLIDSKKSGGCSGKSNDTEFYGYESFHTAIEINLKQVCPQCLPALNSRVSGVKSK